jgi:cob(I)alamin adenosyltransferase
VRLAGGVTDAAAAEQLKRSIIYLNRLSDYFFMLARHINRTQDIEDILWKR